MVQVITEKEVEAAAWCEYSNDDECQYRLQINNISKRAVRKVAKSCAGWRDSGFGWHPKTGYKILIYSKKFKTPEEWLEWAKHFPYKLIELNSKGKPSLIKLGEEYLQK
jgi:hypothetical protein